MDEVYVTICDDEARWREDIRKLCERYAKEKSVNLIISEYSSGKEVIANKSKMCDILFLDIELKDMNGIDVKNSLQDERINTRIIFITSHFEIVTEAFGRNVYGFLTKPLDRLALNRKLDLMITYMIDDRKTIMLDNYGKCKLVYLKNVVYIEAAKNYSKIYTLNDENYLFSDKSIGFWKEYLASNGFEMSMRSILVNLMHVDKIGQTNVYMKNGVSLDISRRMKKHFDEVYKEYIWNMGY